MTMPPNTAVQPNNTGQAKAQFSSSALQILLTYAKDTWRSFLALTGTNGLPADHIYLDGEPAPFTSPSNIAAYLWSVIAAHELRIIETREALHRIQQTLESIANLERDPSNGQFYNWYQPQTGETLRSWPSSGSPLTPFLSSVDNAWLAVALIMVKNAFPSLESSADALLRAMDFGFYYDPTAELMYGGYWSPPSPHSTGFTRHHYSTLNTETRIISYLAIANQQAPASHYFKMWRNLPHSFSYSGKGIEKRDPWSQRSSAKPPQFGSKIVRSWGGSMFEALMVPLFIPEQAWGRESWCTNHQQYVRAQIWHGAVDNASGFWGYSPAMHPSGGYREFGVPFLGMSPAPYPSEGVVAPYACLLALDYAPGEVLRNLEKLCRSFDIYSEWGFWDAVNVNSHSVARCVLALDQGMIMASIANALTEGQLRNYFISGEIEHAIRPLLSLDTFTTE